MKHIGILAHSFEGATLCFRTACLEGVQAARAAHASRDHHDLQPDGAGARCMGSRRQCRRCAHFFMKDAQKLAAAGCDFFVLPDNTAHIAMEIDGRAVSDSRSAHRRGRGRQGAQRRPDEGRHPRHQLDDDRPGLSGRARPPRHRLGNSGRGGPQDRPRHHHRRTVPGRVHERVARRLCPDHREAGRRRLRRGRSRLHRDPAADHTGCLALPILDSTRLLAAAAVEVALGERPMPEWRGGPV